MQDTLYYIRLCVLNKIIRWLTINKSSGRESHVGNHFLNIIVQTQARLISRRTKVSRRLSNLGKCYHNDPNSSSCAWNCHNYSTNIFNDKIHGFSLSSPLFCFDEIRGAAQLRVQRKLKRHATVIVCTAGGLSFLLHMST